MGVAGDMLMSALCELHPNPEDFIKRMNELNIPGVHIEKASVKKCGIVGTHISVAVNGAEEDEHIHDYNHEHTHEHSHHHHSGMKDIEHIISHLNLPEGVHNDVISVYRLIAEAESKAHNCEVADIHFHEVGTMDAIADIVGVCTLIDELGVDEIISSPINVGKGQVKCAHGILPVPAPATAYILRNVPIYSNDVTGELCTPTGAALLKHFATKFVSMPAMRVNKIGYGFGTRDFGVANCVRAFIGDTDEMNKTDRVVELMCNIDDMSGERMAFASEMLLNNGALDVFTTPIGMKKGRPATLLTCLCKENDRDKMLSLIFKHTTTIGVRENILNRYVLDRTEEVVSTNYGKVKAKKSSGYGVVKIKPEYDELRKLAIENNIDIADIVSEG
jgi:hypothetical protein